MGLPAEIPYNDFKLTMDEYKLKGGKENSEDKYEEYIYLFLQHGLQHEVKRFKLNIL